MAVYTVVAVADLIAHQRVTHSATALTSSVIGSVITPTVGALLARIGIFHGFREATANTNPQIILIQTRLEASNDQWIDNLALTTTNGTPITTDITATEPIGEDDLAVTATGSFANGDKVYIDDATADTDDEWHTIRVNQSSTVMTIAAGLVNAKAAGDDVYSLAESWDYEMSLAGVLEYRAVYLNNGATAANTAIWVRTVEVSAIA